MTQALFTDDAYLQRCDAVIEQVVDHGVVLNQTVFYPLGGGQPGDRGYLQTADGRQLRVVDTRKGEAGAIVHYVADGHGLQVGDTVSVQLDWDRRYRHMRMHTALHLLGAVIPFGVTGGNISEQKSRLDFDMADTVDKESVTQQVNTLINADHPVSTRWITDEELDAQPELVRTMSVQPPRGVGRVRLLAIGDVDLQPCGGTHVKHTGEIGPIKISKVEKKGKHNRRINLVFEEE